MSLFQQYNLFPYSNPMMIDHYGDFLNDPVLIPTSIPPLECDDEESHPSLEQLLNSIYKENPKIINIHQAHKDILEGASKFLAQYLSDKHKMVLTHHCLLELETLFKNNNAIAIQIFPGLVDFAAELLTEYYYYNNTYKKIFNEYWSQSSNIATKTLQKIKEAAKQLETDRCIIIKDPIDKVFLCNLMINIASILLSLVVKYKTTETGKKLIKNLIKRENMEFYSTVSYFEELIYEEKKGANNTEKLACPSEEEQAKQVTKKVKNQIKIKDVMILAYLMKQQKEKSYDKETD